MAKMSEWVVTARRPMVRRHMQWHAHLDGRFPPLLGSFKVSERMRDALPTYMQAKCESSVYCAAARPLFLTRRACCCLCAADEADLNLSKRTAFPWTVLRPSTLLDEAVGKVSLSRKETIAVGVPRESVAMTLLKIAELPKGTPGADGKMWDLTKGDGDIEVEVQEAAKRGTSDWVG